jgi:hypothetical protein
MSSSHRPYIKMNFSKWEVFLVLIHVLIIGIEAKYYLIYWHNIPDVIISHSGRGINMNKYSYCQLGIFQSFCMMIVSVFLSLNSPRRGYFKDWKGRSLSLNLNKAKQQYRVEISNLLCSSLAIRLGFLLMLILDMENRIEHIDSFDNWLVLSVMIFVLIIWLIHHILWTKLADKSS